MTLARDPKQCFCENICQETQEALIGSGPDLVLFNSFATRLKKVPRQALGRHPGDIQKAPRRHPRGTRRREEGEGRREEGERHPGRTYNH